MNVWTNLVDSQQVSKFSFSLSERHRKPSQAKRIVIFCSYKTCLLSTMFLDLHQNALEFTVNFSDSFSVRHFLWLIYHRESTCMWKKAIGETLPPATQNENGSWLAFDHVDWCILFYPPIHNLASRCLWFYQIILTVSGNSLSHGWRVNYLPKNFAIERNSPKQSSGQSHKMIGYACYKQ